MAESPVDHPVVLFDGVCNLCTNAVQFLIERDPEGLFRFAPLQSPIAQELLADCELDEHDLDSIVLVDGGECYVKSDAVIRIATTLGGVYRLLGPTAYVPQFLRDGVYDLVADSRYEVFGKRDQCMVPTPAHRARFLAGEPQTEDLANTRTENTE